MRSRDLQARCLKASAVVAALSPFLLAPAPASAALGDLGFSNCIEHVVTPTGVCGGNVGEVRAPESLTISPDGTSAYAVGGPFDFISQYSRNPNTGALTYVTCYRDVGTTNCPTANNVPGLDGVSNLAISPDGRSLYAASGGDDAVIELARDPSNGNLDFTTNGACLEDEDTQPSGVSCANAKALDGAIDVTVSPDGESVYVASFEFGEMAIAHFDRTKTGNEPGLGALNQDSDDPCEVTAGAGAENGCASAAPGIKGPREIAVTPNGQQVYVVDQQMDGISIFDRLTLDDVGDLTPDGCIEDDTAAGAECGMANEAPGLSGAASLAIGPGGGQLYSVSQTDAAVVTFVVLAGGQLDPVTPCFEDVHALDSGCSQIDGLTPDTFAGPNGSRAVAISPDGLSLYVASGNYAMTNHGDDALVIFGRDPTTGVLTSRGCIKDNADNNGGLPNPPCAATSSLLEGPAGLAFGSNTQLYATTGEEAIVTFRRDLDGAGPTAPGSCAGRQATTTGTAGNDVLQGTPGRDVITGLGGRDLIRGLAGKDLLCGGAARDRLIGGASADRLLGEGGGDVLKGGARNDTLKGGLGRDRLLGGAGRDRLLGGPGRDRLRGGPGRDRLRGGPGRDRQVQ